MTTKSDYGYDYMITDMITKSDYGYDYMITDMITKGEARSNSQIVLLYLVKLDLKKNHKNFKAKIRKFYNQQN